MTPSGPVRVGIVGFGLLGRSLLRLSLSRPDLEVAAVADGADPEMLRYLLQFSTLPGRFESAVSLDDGSLCVDGQGARLLGAASPADAPWKQLGVSTVVDFSDTRPTRDELARHLDAGAERVLRCGRSGGGLDRTVVVGLNDHQVGPSHRILSVGSLAAHCAAPLLGVLHEAFGVEQAFLGAVQAYGAGSRLADVPAPEMRVGRAAGENIIPVTTDAAAEVEAVLPELSGRVSAAAMNVPVSNGSVVDLVCWHRSAVSVSAIDDAVAAAADDSGGRLRVEREAIVSADTAGSRASCIFDSRATMVLGERVSKTIAWFDTGWGYVHRLAELIATLGAAEAGGAGQSGEAAATEAAS